MRQARCRLRMRPPRRIETLKCRNNKSYEFPLKQFSYSFDEDLTQHLYRMFAMHYRCGKITTRRPDKCVIPPFSVLRIFWRNHVQAKNSHRHAQRRIVEE